MSIRNTIFNIEPIKLFIIGILTIGIISFSYLKSSNAQIQNRCNTRDSVIELLHGNYEEYPVAVGVTNTGGLVEVLSASNGGTWTIIVTTPQGMSCLVAAGEGWRQVTPLEKDPGT